MNKNEYYEELDKANEQARSHPSYTEEGRELKNLKLAELLGWKDLSKAPSERFVGKNPSGESDVLPDWTRDLNALFEVHQSLTDDQFYSFKENMDKVMRQSSCGNWWKGFIALNADQLIDALIATLSQAADQ